MHKDLIEKQIALGIITLFRVTPWILMGDQRDLSALVAAALDDAKGFTQSDDYFTILRGAMHNWLQVLGHNINPAIIEAIIGEVTTQVTKEIEDKFDDGLMG